RTALNDVLRHPSVLNCSADGILADALDGHDGPIADQRDWYNARASGYASHMHRAGTASGNAATILGAGHLQFFAQHPEQRSTGIDGHFFLLTVPGELIGFHAEPPSSGLVSARRASSKPGPRRSHDF